MRLTLSQAAKRIVILFIVLGVAVTAGTVTVSALSSGTSTRTANKLYDYHAEVGSAFNVFATETRACAGQIACLHEADGRMAAALDHFGQQIDSLAFPETVVAEAQQLRADVTGMVALLHQIEAAPPVEYNRLLPQLQALATKFDADYAVVVRALPS